MQRSPQWFALFHTFEDPSILFERSIVDVYVILSALDEPDLSLSSIIWK